MGFQAWILNRRLERLRRRQKALHEEQARIRKRLSDLERRHKQGAVTPDEYEAERERLRDLKETVTAELGDVAAKEDDVKAALEAVS